jgi:hypothetical protein
MLYKFFMIFKFPGFLGHKKDTNSPVPGHFILFLKHCTKQTHALRSSFMYDIFSLTVSSQVMAMLLQVISLKYKPFYKVTEQNWTLPLPIGSLSKISASAWVLIFCISFLHSPAVGTMLTRESRITRTHKNLF